MFIFKHANSKDLEDSDRQPGKLLGNIYFGYFLGFLLSAGSALALMWPHRRTNWLDLLTHWKFYHQYSTTLIFCMQLLVLVVVVCNFLDGKYKFEHDFLKRAGLQLLIGFSFPILVVGFFIFLGQWIHNADMLHFFYSRHLWSLILSILFIFNIACCFYSYVVNNPKLPDPLKIYPAYIWADYGKTKIRLEVNKIICFQRIGKSTLVSGTDGKEYVSDLPLKIFEAELDPATFFRANRTFLIQRSSVSGIKERSDGGLVLYLKNIKGKLEISVSKEKAESARNWMAGELGLAPVSPKHIYIPCL